MYLKRNLVFILCLIMISVCFSQEEEDYVLNNHKTKNLDPNFKKNIYDIVNPDYTSYFISPTAFTIPKYNFRLANNDLLFFKGTYGLTNNTNISLTTTLFGSIIGSIKHAINLDDEKTLSFSASFGDFTASLIDTNILFSNVDVNFTFGTHQNSFTIGTGGSFISSNIELISSKQQIFIHTLNFGFQTQISRKGYVMIDGYYFTNYNILTAAAGLKFIMGKRFTLNVGVMPILWNNIRSSRYDIQPVIMPVASFRVLLGRKD